MRTRILAVVGLSLLTLLPLRAADFILTEFAANNVGPLTDEDGEFSDWIEIHNPNTNAASLLNWHLTDSQGNPGKWTFPATNMAPNGYLVVFASNKDRRTAGKELHTNFKLDAGGEYVALTRPDLSVASFYSPTVQIARVTYGLPVVQTVTTLIPTGALARVYVPTNDVLGGTWIGEGFDDSAWLATVTGVGFETDIAGPFTPVAIADSVAEFSGVQGSNNWYYGYWDKAADPSGTYQDFDMSFFPNANEAYGSNNFWNGSAWDWFNGDPPFTQLTAQGGLANSSNGVPGRAEHWAIRRYVSEVSGPVKITGHIQHTSDWVYVTQTGAPNNSTLYIYLTAAGEGYIDDMKVVAGSTPEVGQNLLANGDFESTLSPPWTVSDNHFFSSIVTNLKHGGAASLHLVATNGGTTQGSAIWQTISPALGSGTYTLSYWYKPGSNNTPAIVRFSGSLISTAPQPCGDGVTARILVDGNEVFSQGAFISSSDYVLTTPVNFGSRVDFVIDPRTNDFCDGVIFTSHIETADPGNAIVADSTNDWSTAGTQGFKNWTYGYYNKTADTAVPGYQSGDFIPFPRNTGPAGPGNYWTGTDWDWYAGNPPWDQIGQIFMHPNGINNSAEHWAIRRWVSEVSGALTVEWTVKKQNLNGNGVTGKVMHNGSIKDTATIAGNDGVGVSRSIVISNVVVGDFIDIALDPNGIGGTTDDGSDGSYMTAIIRGTPTLSDSVSGDIASVMKGVNSSAYIRIPFVVTNAAAIQFLTLRMKYDDGFVAYLNGVNIAQRNSQFFQEPVTWNSVATTNRFDGDVNQPEDIDVTSFAGLLHDGTNVLAIQGLNAHANDSDFLILPTLQAFTVSFGSTPGYFSSPTPGAANGPASTNIGPIIAMATHTPNVPRDHENLIVTAQVFPSFFAISNVQMIYRVAFSNEVTLPMFDDGLHGDGAAGDGTYGATIPATAANPGQMIRYYISATDIRTNASRMPTYEDPLNSPQYFGTVVYLPQTNALPMLHWFIANPSAANTEAGTRCSIFYNDQFLDNVGVTLHGQSSASFPKHSYNFNLNKGYKLDLLPGTPKVSDFALISTWADRTHFRVPLNTETYQEAGCPAHYTWPLRVQQNESFYMVCNLSEQGNEEYLERIGYDPNGSLYKMYNTFTGAAGNEKKTRKFENTDDLQNFYNAIIVGGSPALNYIYDNVNLPSMIDFLAVKTISSDHDCCHKNYYFYRDSDKSGEWFGLPWDFDLSWGHIWTNTWAYFSDTMNTNLFIGVGNNNTLFALMWNDASMRSMWVRRTRTLMDQILQAPGTTTSNDFLRGRIDYYASQVRADATLDKIKWGGAAWQGPHYGPPNLDVPGNATTNFENELVRVKDYYLPGRRTYLASVTPSTIPTSQPNNLFVPISAVEFNPASANQAQEYIELNNTNNVAVDMTGWRLKGAVDFPFPPGTVIPAATKLYVSPDVKAFRARTTGPRGGQRLFVIGGYNGQLSARGETLALVNSAGQTNTTLTYVGAPSLAQQYLRITEVMYHPADPGTGSLYGREEFEYIELKNIGPVALNLTGVHFTNGIEFTFTSATVTNLNPGERIVLAKNLAAFASRYPSVTNVTGPYIGALDNNGETIRLDDVVGEKILEFAYNNSWYPMTDGPGLSLVIINENAPWYTWGDKESWRPSSDFNGTPGGGDSAPLTFAPILVNEVLTHTDFPALDSIELYNPTTNDVDISNWLISDDFISPKKFRIPTNTIILAGGYRVYTESDFNAGPTAFSFSSKGDEAYLFSGDVSGNPNGYYHGFNFDAAQNGVSFGRYINSVGEEHFVAQSSNTFGFPNARPKVGPVVISEIMYRPPDIILGTNVLDDSDNEFVELQNITTNVVRLYDPLYPTNKWRLQDGIDYVFSTNDVIAPNGFLVVVNFDPVTNAPALATFRAKYGVPTNVPMVGPYSGKLDNSGEKIELYRPDNPDPSSVPFILVERVHYGDSAPWNPLADGFGASLNRIVVGDYGNDPTNWTAALPSPGAAFGGAPPMVTQQPYNAIVFSAGSGAMSDVYPVGVTNFVASVSGSGLRYQWLFNNTNIIAGATNAVLTLTNIQSSQAGAYSYIAFNTSGSTISSNGILTVLSPVAFSIQPTNQNVLPGTNVTLVAQAVGNGTIRYQWRFEGTNILNATNASYSFTGANLTNHHGNFSVVAQDDLSMATSSNAFIYVLVKVGIVTQPVAQTVLQGGNATFSVVATGAPPLWYRWIRNGAAVLTNQSPTFTVFNVQASGNVRVAVTNTASPAGVNSSTVTLTIIPDADGDGMADSWEIAYFGSTNASPTLDADGDGMSNRDEYLAGTNPTNAASVLKIVVSATNASQFTFLAQSNVTYSVQWKTNINSGVWTNLTNIGGQTGVRTIQVNTVIAPQGPERYFRVITPLVP